MRFIAVILALVQLLGCVVMPQQSAARVRPDGGFRLNLVWHEVKDSHGACLKFYNLGRVRHYGSVMGGCSGWLGDEFHIITGIVRHETHLCTVGHEVAHGKLGHFHDNDGNWIITRE